jgi:hypothetical protein
VNNTMQIFRSEIKAGLADQIKNNTIAFCSEVSRYTPTEVEINEVKNIKAIAEAKDGQMDLYYVKSILASVGWNKNDDVFDPVEMWKAKSSPVDKQFNFMHDEKDIIGHITSCYSADAAGNMLPDFNDMSQVPSVFDIVTGSVLYTSWSDPKLKDRMKKIIADIDSGKTWHVSMECLFPAFDYAMIGSNGEQKVVKREEASAFLTKHLRAYGGKGEYDGYKVGRLLRNFSFSGVGLVEKPANPRSIILNNQKSINFIISQAEEINMQDELELLKAELAEAKEAKDKMKEEAGKMKEEAEKAKKAKSEAEAEATAAKEDAKNAKEEAKKSKDEAEMAKKSKAESEEELDKMKKEKMMQKRKAALAEVGINDVSAFEALADEAFEAIHATMKKAAAAKPKQNPVEEKENEPAGPEGDKVKTKKDAKAAEEFDSNEADAEVLDSAVANSNHIPMVDAVEEEDLRSFASEWFSTKVLKSTANIK